MNRYFHSAICICCAMVAQCALSEICDYVNPFIGATTSVETAGTYHGLGKTFPGATTPFGMVQVSPNTITGGDNGSGYSDEHTSIEGFAFTQMSGVGWYGDLGNFLVMPTCGKLFTAAGTPDSPENGYRSRYTKESEHATAGYYTVTLSDYNIQAEATAAPHSGILRFTYPAHECSRIQIDLARRVGGTSTWQEITVLDDRTIAGYMECTPDGGGWGNGEGKAEYTVYFYASFSKPLRNYGVWNAIIPDSVPRRLWDVTSKEYQQRIANADVIRDITHFAGKHIGFFTEFSTDPGETVIMKAGISFVSVEGARRNLLAEIPHWDFDLIHFQARELWNRELSKITITGSDENTKQTFYTALYHTMIDPRSFSDTDGHYRGGDGRIHQASNFTKRTVFSGWDVFRSQMPLQTLINPTVVNDMLQSLATLADESGKGYYERWEFLNAYTGCMLGNPAVSVLADAVAKQIYRHNLDTAYRIARRTIELFGNGERGYSPGNYGISETLEYSYNEWCLAQIARQAGYLDDYTRYLQRSQSYRNIYDPQHKSFRPRNDQGEFLPWPEEGCLAEWYGCIESNPLQQGWFVPHDVDGLTQLSGGPATLIANLDTMFARTPNSFLWNSYYNHANEPVHHVPFLYNRLGNAWKTQKETRRICTHAYRNEVAGLIGNEDVGQMSAWYVLASIGIYPVCPGNTRMEITSPLFDCITIRCGDDKIFTIVAHNNSAENIYIQSACLNGKPYDKCYIDYADIVSGGILELTLGKEPSYGWGKD